MSIRCTPESVQKILLDNYDKSSQLDSFIATASALTDWVQAQDITLILTPALLTEIEKYLAAHFYQIADPGYQSRSTGGASGQFTGQTAMVLNQTRYGQMAMTLDMSGALERRSKEVEEGGRRIIQVYASTQPGNYADPCGLYTDPDCC
jgi:hypothetical protein